jgi:hypothetical protein
MVADTWTAEAVHQEKSMKMSTWMWIVASMVFWFAVGWMLPSPLADTSRRDASVQGEGLPEPLKIFIDRETGCEYVGLDRGPLAPRVNADDRPMCLPVPVAPR